MEGDGLPTKKEHKAILDGGEVGGGDNEKAVFVENAVHFFEIGVGEVEVFDCLDGKDKVEVVFLVWLFLVYVGG